MMRRAARAFAQALRSILSFPSVSCVDPVLLPRALEVHEPVRIDVAETYPVACAEIVGVRRIVPSTVPRPPHHP